jgi:hypothetical protein
MRLTFLTAGAMALVALPGAGFAQHDLPMPSCIASTLDGYALARLVPPEAKGATARAVRGVVRRVVTWPVGATLQVCFRSGTEIAQKRVARYAREWMQHANVALDFGEGASPRKCRGDGSEDIKIDFVDKAGWWSALGTLGRGREHTMNFEFMGVDEPAYATGQRMSEAAMRRVVLHEFGHSLGLAHEHQSPNAGCDSEFDWEKVYALGASWGWDQARIDRAFRQLANAEEYNLTEVDRRSIMHYSLPASIFKLGVNSPCWIAGNYELSAQDRTFIRTIYPKKDDPVVVSSVPEGMTTRSGPARTSSEREAVVKDYERLLREAGVAAGKAAELTAEFRRIALGR